MLLFFFLMIRRPPRSTLFPYTDALPIYAPVRRALLGRGTGDGAGRAGRVAGARLESRSGGHRTGRSSAQRSEEHTSELQSQSNLVCRLLLEKIKNNHLIPL